MGETITLLEILTDVAPLVLSTLILGGIVLLTLYATIKVGIPALRESVEMFEAQRQSWATLLEEQKRWHAHLADDLRKELTEQEEARARLEKRVADQEQARGELEKRVAELEETLKTREAQIATLESEVEKLREEDVRKERRIQELTKELEQVQQERDGLRKRLEALEAASKDDGKKEGGKIEHEKPAAEKPAARPVPDGL